LISEIEDPLENIQTHNAGETAKQEKTEKPENQDTRVTLDERIDRLAKVFEECHNQASTDYLASRVGVSSEDLDKILKTIKNAFKIPGEDTWRWST
ncbi:MAG: hypothetical protein NTY03_01910, partial [Candidatus Bathyarchaeota archaeon]|nr:hypothetical protein [Candidatus Bathyarchaeota archaeon]